MKRNLIKIITTLICVCMMLTSCSVGNTVDIGNVAYNYDMIINSSSDIKCDYLLLYPRNADSADLTAYVDFLEALSNAGNTTFQLAPDSLVIPKATQKLILLGNTTYSESSRTSYILDNVRINNYYDYLIKGFENKISIAWKSADGRKLAFEKILEEFPKNLTAATDAEYTYMHLDQSEDYPIFSIADVSITEYTIVIPKGCAYFVTQSANQLAEAVFEATGKEIKVVTDDADETEYEILIGSTNRGQSAVTDFYAVSKYAVVEQGGKLVIQGGQTSSVVECVNMVTDMVKEAYHTARPVIFKAKSYILGNMAYTDQAFSNGYRLVYSEDFSDGIDEDIYKKIIDYRLLYGEKEAGMNFLKQNVDHEDGNMDVFMTSQDGVVFESGRVITKEKLEMKYGYIEIRAKIDAFDGIWTRAYLYGENKEKNAASQIDIINCFDKGENLVSTAGTTHLDTYQTDLWKQYESIHDRIRLFNINGEYPKPEELPEDEKEDGKKKDNKKEETKKEESKEETTKTETDGNLTIKKNLSDDYHIFGVEWTESYIRFTFDGAEYGILDIKSEEFDSLRENMYLVFEISADTTSTVVDKNMVDFPVIFSIDWINIYQRDGAGEISILNKKQ